ncbi:unnamed protein product [Linum tenue]|uniref:Uncharacterized protein n=1 Tax=Linum tenue TaxID=586396 RepID=A0AAV0P3W0_9ROSI|nr:unnamed protein product [Linum tenue]
MVHKGGLDSKFNIHSAGTINYHEVDVKQEKGLFFTIIYHLGF